MPTVVLTDEQMVASVLQHLPESKRLSMEAFKAENEWVSQLAGREMVGINLDHKIVLSR